MEYTETQARAGQSQLEDLLDDPALLARMARDGSLKILLRFAGDKRIWTTGEPLQPVRLLVVDTETTGKKYGADKVIEFGGVLVLADRVSGLVYRVEDAYNALQDPGMPIPPETTQVNGITDAMVAGQSIDVARVADLVQRCDYVLAHNAGFDRPFLEDLVPEFRNKPWVCSVKQIDWSSEGIGSAKLDYVAMCLGFFYSAHRAEVDCIALIEALSKPLPVSGRTGLSLLLDRCNQIDYDLHAVGSPYETKDMLKDRGYQWLDKSKEGGLKAWHRPLSEEELKPELEWLKSNIYAGRSISLPVVKVTSLERFSNREGVTEMVYA